MTMVEQPNSDESILTALESQLEKAERQAYIDRGRLFKELRGEGKYSTRFYQTAGFDTFEQYCEARWDRTSKRVEQLIRAYEIAQILGTKVSKIPPSEKAARPLTTLRKLDDTYDEDAIKFVWESVQGTGRNGAVLAKDVAKAVNEYWADATEPEPNPEPEPAPASDDSEDEPGDGPEPDSDAETSEEERQPTVPQSRAEVDAVARLGTIADRLEVLSTSIPNAEVGEIATQIRGLLEQFTARTVH